MENLCRGVVAVRVGSNNFVSWRLFGYEPDSIAFNVYRGSTKVNASPITDSTNTVDTGAPANATYTVRAVVDGVEQGASEAATTWAQNYLEIPLQAPSGYTPGDASAGDLDGDGHYDLVVKWENSPQDNANAGVTGQPKLEGVTLGGKSLWRIDLGRNIREGAHYTQFMVYDLDGDGDSELVVKTAPGTRDGTGAFLKAGPAANDDDNADYRNDDGYILTGPEYLTVFDGRTGAELVTVNFEIARGNVSSWGDDYGNRVDRFLGAVAFVGADGRPSVLMARGYYTRSTITAWNFRDGKLTRLWTSDSNANTNWTASTGGAAGAGAGAGWEVTTGLSKTKVAPASAITAGTATAATEAGLSVSAFCRLESAFAADRAVRANIAVTAAATPSCWPRNLAAGSRKTLRTCGEEDAGWARRRPCLGYADKMEVLSTPAKLAVGFGRVDCPAGPPSAPRHALQVVFTPRCTWHRMWVLRPRLKKEVTDHRRGLARRSHPYPVWVCNSVDSS
jgi:hypothetical protein